MSDAPSIQALERDLRAALLDEDFEHLAALDVQVRRELSRGVNAENNAESRAGATVQELESLRGLYGELVQLMERKKQSYANELKRIQSGKKGVHAYQQLK